MQFGSTIIEYYAGKVVRDEGMSVAEKIECLVRLAVKTSRDEKTLIRLYHEMSSLGNNELMAKVPQSLESFTAKHYARMLEEGQRKGEVSRQDLDARLAAFAMDNIFMALQYAYLATITEFAFKFITILGLIRKKMMRRSFRDT